MKIAALCCLLILSPTIADATMPSLTDQPKPASPAACRDWAAKQDAEAIELWGIQENGKHSKAIGLERLMDWCMGRGKPEIVGFGSSAGFDRDYCMRNPSQDLCRSSRREGLLCRVQEPKGMPLNVRTSPNGTVVGTLPNGTGVSIFDQTRDRRSQTWVYVKRASDDQPLGWVFGDSIHCSTANAWESISGRWTADRSRACMRNADYMWSFTNETIESHESKCEVRERSSTNRGWTVFLRCRIEGDEIWYRGNIALKDNSTLSIDLTEHKGVTGAPEVKTSLHRCVQ